MGVLHWGFLNASAGSFSPRSPTAARETLARGPLCGGAAYSSPRSCTFTVDGVRGQTRAHSIYLALVETGASTRYGAASAAVSSWTMAAWPLWVATERAVAPLLVTKRGLAPRASSSRTTSKWPFWLAM